MQSKTINAPIGAVWEKLNDFHDLSWAIKILPSCEKIGDMSGTQVGAKRILNGAFHETLTEVDPANHLLKYSIDDGPSPVSKEEVSNYIGIINLSTSVDGGTLVEWSSSWDANSEEAVEFCHGIYVALLNELAEVFNYDAVH